MRIIKIMPNASSLFCERMMCDLVLYKNLKSNIRKSIEQTKGSSNYPMTNFELSQQWANVVCNFFRLNCYNLFRTLLCKRKNRCEVAKQSSKRALSEKNRNASLQLRKTYAIVQQMCAIAIFRYISLSKGHLGTLCCDPRSQPGFMFSNLANEQHLLRKCFHQGSRKASIC